MRLLADTPPPAGAFPTLAEMIATAYTTDCHGLARDRVSSLDQPAIPRLPTIEIGRRDVSLEAHSIQDLEELADVATLWDIRDRATAEESRGESR